MKKSLQNLSVSLFGNRLTTLGWLALATSIYLNYASKSDKQEPTGHPAADSASEFYRPTLVDLARIHLLFVAGFSLGATQLGRTTPKFYRRARESIEKTGYLDERIAREIIQGSENRAFMGYCQQQGLYLAARDTGQLEAFEEARQKYSKVQIPHF